MEELIKEWQEKFGKMVHEQCLLYEYGQHDPDVPRKFAATLLTEARKKWIDDLARTVAEHIQKNWYASLGYGNDVEVITRGCDDLDWLLGALGITTQDILKALGK